MSTPRKLRCVLAQLNLVVGDVEGNTSRIIAAANRARDEMGADVVMVPELAVSGYPPEDLLVPLGHAFAGRPLHRPPQGGGARNHLDCRLSGIRRRPYLQFGAGASRWRRARQSPQGLPAQLPRVRREALLHAGHQAHGGRAERHQGRNSGVRGRLGARARGPGARRRRRSAAGDQRLSL